TDNTIRFGWDKSVDLQGDSVSYKLQIATTPNFSNIVKEQTLAQTEVVLPKLANGVYYLKVTAKDSKGNSQNAFDTAIIGGKKYFGVYAFEVKTNEIVGL
ncbi:MAG: fibronectin type III domain-containing protein, partial [Agitococcus sp.]